MNVIGIDYQQTLSVICLREGQELIRFRTLGDGLRPIIPNAVLENGLWGSRAFLATSPENVRHGNPAQEEPWLDEPEAPLFWQGIARHLYSYLGQISPTKKNGYQVIVGLQSSQFNTVTKSIERFCHEASLNEVVSISACDALLCRWLGEQAEHAIDVSAVVVVVVQDTTTAVTAYQLHWSADHRLLHLVPGLSTRYLSGGHSAWMSRMLGEVHSRFKEPISAGYELALHDAILEFISRMKKEEAESAIEWTGFLHEQMYTSFELSQQDCVAWPEVRSFLSALASAVDAVLSEVRNSSRSTRLLVGGIGALWPFVGQTVASMGRVWQSASPQDDIARGATWWPDFQAQFTLDNTALADNTVLRLPESASPTLLSDEPEQEAINTDYEGEIILDEEESESPLLPPWQRRVWPISE